MIRYLPMFLKLLLTALVIAGAFMALRIRKSNPGHSPARLAPIPMARPKSALPRMAAITAVLLMLSGAALFLYQQWRDSTQVVTVRIINANNGRETDYQAYKGDVDGRSFKTVDGRLVTLAESERMELGIRD